MKVRHMANVYKLCVPTWFACPEMVKKRWQMTVAVSTIHGNGRKVGQRETKSGYIICRILRLLYYLTKIGFHQVTVIYLERPIPEPHLCLWYIHPQLLTTLKCMECGYFGGYPPSCRNFETFILCLINKTSRQLTPGS